MDIALVGIGKIARDQHVPSIAASKDWNLKATVSRHSGVEGVDRYSDFEAFLKQRQDISVVSLCMPPVPRFSYAEAAIRAKRHVMLEKPPGASLAECHKLARLAEEHSVSLFATWHSREAPLVDAARDWLKGRELSRLHVTWKEDVRRWHPGQDWIWEPGGMGVFDPGINALSIVTKMLPQTLHLRGAWLGIPENKQGPIAAQLEYTHPTGAEVSAEFDWRQEGDQTWQIEAETIDGGHMLLEDGGARLQLNGVQQAADGPALAGEYPRLYTRMAELVATGRSDFDLEPLRHVADAFMLGHREALEPFHE